MLGVIQAHAAATDNRLALVIGNSNYQDAPLANPQNDAHDMAEVLTELGFDVILETDADRRQMARAIRDFGRRLKQNRGVGLFYYAGHGMQLDNHNYLIPVDSPMQEEDEIPYESIDVGSVLAKMQSAGNALNLLILDACRNNPFPRRFRSSNRGLARVEAPVGSLVVYATAPGAVAADGDGRNGTFTHHLIRNLRQSGLSLTQTIRRTRAAVVKETGGLQVPWESSSLLEDYYLSPVATAKSPVLKEDESLDILYWKSVAKANNRPEYEAYLDKFPNGLFAELAQARIRQLTTVVAEPEEPSAEPSPGSSPGSSGPNENTLAALTPSDLNTKALRLTPSSSETAQQPQPESAIKPSPATFGELTVDVVPPAARVRIMNIVEKYKPGIRLARAKSYDVFVTHDGYESWRKNIELTSSKLVLNVELEKRQAGSPTVVALAGGTFRMGCSAGDSLCERYEKPAREITVNSMAMTATEVTVGQFRRFVTATGFRTDAEKNAGGFSGCYVWSESGGISRSNAKWSWNKKRNWRDPGYSQSDNHAVTCVSWNDAQAYADWLSKETGRRYRLPSEAEWEYAARAGSTGAYGVTSARDLCRHANGADATRSPKGSKWSGRLSCSDGHWFTAPVRTFKANRFGLYDMLGNVWEWTADNWHSNYNNSPVDGEAFLDGKTDRVLRGGAWDGVAKNLRVSNRSKGAQSRRAAMIGFRLVREH